MSKSFNDAEQAWNCSASRDLAESFYGPLSTEMKVLKQTFISVFLGPELYAQYLKENPFETTT